MLTLPDVRQTRSWDCARAVTASVFDLYGLGPVPDPWPGTAMDGTDPRTLESVLWAAGLAVQAGVMTLADLRHQTEAAHRPVIVLTRFKGEGHYQIVRGARNRRVYYQCPVSGMRSDPEPTFLRRWRDIDRWGVHWHRFGITAYPMGE